MASFARCTRPPQCKAYTEVLFHIDSAATPMFCELEPRHEGNHRWSHVDTMYVWPEEMRCTLWDGAGEAVE